MLGVVEGSLGALPYGTSGYYCGKNGTQIRLYINDTVTSFSAKDVPDGMLNLYNSISLVGILTDDCYNTFSQTIDLGSTADEVAISILQNVLNNLGFMYTDVINVFNNTAATVDDYPYFLAYNIGDFIIRFFWSDPLTSTVKGQPKQYYTD